MPALCRSDCDRYLSVLVKRIDTKLLFRGDRELRRERKHLRFVHLYPTTFSTIGKANATAYSSISQFPESQANSSISVGIATVGAVRPGFVLVLLC